MTILESKEPLLIPERRQKMPRRRVSSGCGVVVVALAVSATLIGGMLWNLWATVQEKQDHEAGLGSFGKSKWNLFYHLGGNGPWIPKLQDDHEAKKEATSPPEGCTVEQVHMLSRHAERFPTLSAGTRMIALLERIKDSGVELRGSLKFLNDWEFITQNPAVDFEMLTRTGPYAGTLQSFGTGVKLRSRYGHLIDSDSATRFWTASSARVVETAQHFGAGFFGLNFEEKGKAKMIVIDGYDPARGADTLTPGKSCIKYKSDPNLGHENGANMLAKFQPKYLAPVIKRLHKENPDIEFDPVEVFAMQEMCGFEILVRGSSPWCKVFTDKEWEGFEYARDIVHYYRSGSGNAYGKGLGYLWLNATATLMRAGGKEAGGAFFSFAHDGDLIPFIAATGLFDEESPLPVIRIPHNRSWRTSTIVPMGGRVILELLSCPRKDADSSKTTTPPIQKYVRLNINDAIIPFKCKDCASGPGQSAPLEKFLRYVGGIGDNVPDFRDMCGLSRELPERITFFKQPGKKDVFAA